ncbi:hypothetical protein GCM10027271_29630 [Saccharopolyspora gloriosae]|uniref:PPE domain-containing protein n=1 Tax=Saccharopolyspora gloriosae TaxID=455344 RepID=A0A840NJG4_9PSEU|nr:PPE domain-containing protein [Saccharopolyspora gloriosae]MBB5071201.1 hypothetical protein [Saccharopolyspora gloriosae]
MGFGEWAGAVGDAVHDAGAHWLGYDTNAQREQSERAQDATRAGERRRNALAEQNERLHTGGEFDPPSITEQENWQSYGHAELYEINERSIDQAQAREIARAWREIGAVLKELGPDLQRDAQAAIDGGWEGDAADAAKASADPLVKWMADSGEAFHLTGNKIEEAGSAAGQAKAMVPEPQDFSIGRTIASSIPGGLVGGGVDALAQMRERQEAERAAQETMQRVLTPTYEDVDATVPAYPGLDGAPLPPPPPSEPPPVEPPPPPVDPREDRNGGTGGSDRRGDQGGNDRGGNERGGGDRKVQPMPYPDENGRPRPDGPAKTDPSWVPDRPEAPQDRTPPRPPGHSQFPPGAVAPPLHGGGGGGRAGGPATGGGTGRGGPGGGIGSGKTGTSTTNPPGPGGRAGVGTPNVGAGPRAAGIGGAAGGAGGARGAMGGGMGGAGRGGQGGEDYEHERPGWLQEQDDVWMDGMPNTAPPVFGE